MWLILKKQIKFKHFLFVKIRCTIAKYLCTVKPKKTVIMGLLDFLFFSSVMNNSSNRKSSSSSNSSHYNSSSYDAGYEEGYDDSCYDHRIHDDYDYHDTYNYSGYDDDCEIDCNW